MASKFTITAELNLQTKNLDQVVNNLKNKFQGTDLNIKIKDLAKAEASIRGISKEASKATTAMSSLVDSIGTGFKRFTVVTLVTGTVVGLTRAIKNSTKEAIEFEREVVKIAQATGKTVGELRALTQEINRISTGFGVASKDLLGAARTLTQAGFSAGTVTKALNVLAQTELAATFDSIQDTTEGAIALLNQFGRTAQKTGTEIDFLERSLSAINQVSKEFAVESSDIITAIRTTGAAFEAAGGQINELIALFTSVRSTTRESAESIATGFRTIFTRVQRLDTIEALRSLGIELQDVEGKFVGPMEAVKRLSMALNTIDPKDFRFNLVVEELGGFRQVSKVIPLIQQFAVAQKALNVAQSSSGSLAKDAQTAQQSLAVQIAKTREEFEAFVRRLTESSSFKRFSSELLGIASALIKVADVLKPLLPLLTTFATIKLGQALLPSLASFGGLGKGTKKALGGKIHHFASGGFVPGTGNGDTVPAMLTPGEFVIRKSSVKKLGAENLARVNKYASGGKIQYFSEGDRVVTDWSSGYDIATKSWKKPRNKNGILEPGRRYTPDEREAAFKRKYQYGEKQPDGKKPLYLKAIEPDDQIALHLRRKTISRLSKKEKESLIQEGNLLPVPADIVDDNGVKKAFYPRSTKENQDIYRAFEKIAIERLGGKNWQLNNGNDMSDEIDLIKRVGKNITEIGDAKFEYKPHPEEKLKAKAFKYFAKQQKLEKDTVFFKEGIKNQRDKLLLPFTVVELAENYKSNLLQNLGLPQDTSKSKIDKIKAAQGKHFGGIIQKFEKGGRAEAFRGARAITIPEPETYTYNKPAGIDLDSLTNDSKNYKVNAGDRLEYNRVNHNIDLDKENVSSGLFSEYKAETDPAKRGKIFEKILLSLGEVQSLSKMQNARLDAISASGNPSEIKSRKEAMNIKELEEKLWGAIVSNADGSLAEMMTRERMNSNRWTDGEDLFNIGDIDVFEDVTGGLGKEINAKEVRTRQEVQAVKTAKEMTKAATNEARAKLQAAVAAVVGKDSGLYNIKGTVLPPLSGKGELYSDTVTAVRKALKIDNVADLWPAIAQMQPSEIQKAVKNSIQRKATGGFIEKFANGGFSSGTDTVPAMLTPGEFVINKKSAQRIGYSSLNRMNKVGKYASGGVVQYFQNGDKVASVSSQVLGVGKTGEGIEEITEIVKSLETTFKRLGLTVDEIDQGFVAFVHEVDRGMANVRATAYEFVESVGKQVEKRDSGVDTATIIPEFGESLIPTILERKTPPPLPSAKTNKAVEEATTNQPSEAEVKAARDAEAGRAAAAKGGGGGPSNEDRLEHAVNYLTKKYKLTASGTDRVRDSLKESIKTEGKLRTAVVLRQEAEVKAARETQVARAAAAKGGGGGSNPPTTPQQAGGGGKPPTDDGDDKSDDPLEAYGKQLDKATKSLGGFSSGAIVAATGIATLFSQSELIPEQFRNSLTALTGTFTAIKAIGDQFVGIFADISKKALMNAESRRLKMSMNQNAKAFDKNSTAVNKNTNDKTGGSENIEFDKGAKRLQTATTVASAAVTGFAVASALEAAIIENLNYKAEKSGQKLTASLDRFSKTFDNEAEVRKNLINTLVASEKAESASRAASSGASNAGGIAGGAIGATIGAGIGGFFGGPAGAAIGAQILAPIGAAIGKFIGSQSENTFDEKQVRSQAAILGKSFTEASLGVNKLNKFLVDIDKKSDLDISKEFTRAGAEISNITEQLGNIDSKTLQNGSEQFKQAVQRSTEALAQYQAKFAELQGAQTARLGKLINAKVQAGFTDFKPEQQMKEMFAVTSDLIEKDFAARIKRAGSEAEKQILTNLKGIALAKAQQELEIQVAEMTLQALEMERAILIEKQAREKIIGTIYEEIGARAATQRFNRSITELANNSENLSAAFGDSVSALKSSVDASVFDVEFASPEQMKNSLDQLAQLGPYGQKLANNFDDLSKVSQNLDAVMEGIKTGGPGLGDPKDVASRIVEGLGIKGGTVGNAIEEMIAKRLKTKGGEQGSPVIGDEETRKQIEESIKKMSATIKEQSKGLLESIQTAEAQQRAILDRILSSDKKKLELANEAVDSYSRYVNAVAQATGKNVPLATKNAIRVAKQFNLLGNSVNKSIPQLGRDLLGARKAIQGTKDPLKQAGLINQAGRLEQALKNLANQSDRTNDTLAEIEKEKGKREALTKSAESYVFGSDENRAGMDKTFSELNNLIASGGNIGAVSSDERGNVASLLDQFKDLDFGGGMTGADIKRQVTAQALAQSGNFALANIVGQETTPVEEMLVNELANIYNEEQMAKAALMAQETMNSDNQIAALQQVTTQIQTFSQQLQATMDSFIGNAQNIANQMGAKPKNDLAEVEQKIEDKQQFIEKANVNLQTIQKQEVIQSNAMAGIQEAKPKALGGLIYRAGGGSIFQPKGTDTVPAMLSPGEFVIRKSSVNKIGVGTLNSINAGGFARGGKVGYYADGGLVQERLDKAIDPEEKYSIARSYAMSRKNEIDVNTGSRGAIGTFFRGKREADYSSLKKEKLFITNTAEDGSAVSKPISLHDLISPTKESQILIDQLFKTKAGFKGDDAISREAQDDKAARDASVKAYFESAGWLGNIGAIMSDFGTGFGIGFTGIPFADILNAFLKDLPNILGFPAVLDINDLGFGNLTEASLWEFLGLPMTDTGSKFNIPFADSLPNGYGKYFKDISVFKSGEMIGEILNPVEVLLGGLAAKTASSIFKGSAKVAKGALSGASGAFATTKGGKGLSSFVNILKGAGDKIPGKDIASAASGRIGSFISGLGSWGKWGLDGVLSPVKATVGAIQDTLGMKIFNAGKFDNFTDKLYKFYLGGSDNVAAKTADVPEEGIKNADLIEKSTKAKKEIKKRIDTETAERIENAKLPRKVKESPIPTRTRRRKEEYGKKEIDREIEGIKESAREKMEIKFEKIDKKIEATKARRAQDDLIDKTMKDFYDTQRKVKPKATGYLTRSMVGARVASNIIPDTTSSPADAPYSIPESNPTVITDSASNQTAQTPQTPLTPEQVAKEAQLSETRKDRRKGRRGSSLQDRLQKLYNMQNMMGQVYNQAANLRNQQVSLFNQKQGYAEGVMGWGAGSLGRQGYMQTYRGVNQQQQIMDPKIASMASAIGYNPDTDILQVSNLSEDEKKEYQELKAKEQNVGLTSDQRERADNLKSRFAPAIEETNRRAVATTDQINAMPNMVTNEQIRNSPIDLSQRDSKTFAMGLNKGGVVYLNGGGSPSSSDTVPAMLTPGEFVMNKSAVSKHGIGFMNHLNRGGEVSYLANGGIPLGMSEADYNVQRGEFLKKKEAEKKAREEMIAKKEAEKKAPEEMIAKKEAEGNVRKRGFNPLGIKNTFEQAGPSVSELRQRRDARRAASPMRQQRIAANEAIKPQKISFGEMYRASGGGRTFNQIMGRTPTRQAAGGADTNAGAVASTGSGGAAGAIASTGGGGAAGGAADGISGAVEPLNQVAQAFSGFADKISSVAEQFSGLKVEHVVTFGGSINIAGFNSEAISKAITDSMKNFVNTKINDLINKNDLKG